MYLVSHCEVMHFLQKSTKTASFTTPVLVVEAYKEAIILVNVTAVGGTAPTLDITLQTSFWDEPFWGDLESFPQITAVGTYVRRLTNFGQYLRCSCVIGGTTPSFEVEIVGVFKT